jgi:predicted RNase H-like nuclease (RuvC/YqgF family)
MVQDALGEENVDYTMGRQDDPNQLPNPAPELNIPEGEESIEEAKPLPKYNSIEELMKEIENGTNEAAHKYKMDEMKRVYEALEAKVGSLEEGEHAEHIDQKAVKQMRKDIAALRKAEEKLRKEFDKKFTGKEKKETPKKDKEVVALQEGFDLRKFLAENRK